MTTFDRVKMLAEKQKISIVELEERLGFGRNSLYSWKKKTPNGESLRKVADYFHVSTDYLLGRTDDPSPFSEQQKDGENIAAFFRLNTANMDPDEREEIESELKDYTQFLIQKALDKKRRRLDK